MAFHAVKLDPELSDIFESLIATLDEKDRCRFDTVMDAALERVKELRAVKR